VKTWPFVGREKEARYVRTELEAGRSVVLTGIHGIGRTALARHVAEEMAREWLFAFVDFDRGPAEVWRGLFERFFPRAHARRRGAARPVQWLRYRVSSGRLEDGRRHAVVLDNVARLTAQRLDSVRRLREGFQVVAILEGFVLEEDRAGLCASLRARPPLELRHLSARATLGFLEECSRRHGFGWGPGEIRGVARAVDGFPLGMREAVEAELRRRRRGAPGLAREAR